MQDDKDPIYNDKGYLGDGIDPLTKPKWGFNHIILA
jgi:hypothetical protein